MFQHANITRTTHMYLDLYGHGSKLNHQEAAGSSLRFHVSSPIFSPQPYRRRKPRLAICCPESKGLVPLPPPAPLPPHHPPPPPPPPPPKSSQAATRIGLQEERGEERRLRGRLRGRHLARGQGAQEHVQAHRARAPASASRSGPEALSLRKIYGRHPCDMRLGGDGPPASG